MIATLKYLWSRKTTAFGYIQVILGVLAATDGVFSVHATKVLILLNGLITAAIGHYNNLQLKRAADKAADTTDASK